MTSVDDELATRLADAEHERRAIPQLVAERQDLDEPRRVGDLIHPRAEPELVFLLGEDVEGPAATVAGVLRATAGILPGLELLDSRYEDFRFTLPDVIADNAGAARFLVGGHMLPADAFVVRPEGMVLRASGAVMATAAGAAVSGRSAAAVAWLAKRVGRPEAGSIVFSGGLTAPVPPSPGVTVSAEYTHLGTVALGAV